MINQWFSPLFHLYLQSRSQKFKETTRVKANLNQENKPGALDPTTEQLLMLTRTRALLSYLFYLRVIFFILMVGVLVTSLCFCCSG